MLREKGYTGSVAALRVFVSKEKRIARDLLKDKEPHEFIDKKWINDAINLQIKELDGYIKGVKNDYDSVVNAVIVVFCIMVTIKSNGIFAFG